MNPTTSPTLIRGEVHELPHEQPQVESASYRSVDSQPSWQQPQTPSPSLDHGGTSRFSLRARYLPHGVVAARFQVPHLCTRCRHTNGQRVLHLILHDPHLAAVGFVWEPLQSIADMVFLLGNHLWPALSHHDVAGSLVSALSMAGAAFQICATLREWGVTRIPRLALTAFFSLNPMILYYAGNGMSEALYLFLLMTCTCDLLRWMRDGDLRSLAYSAVALGFCYLTRNEAALAAALGGSQWESSAIGGLRDLERLV